MSASKVQYRVNSSMDINFLISDKPIDTSIANPDMALDTSIVNLDMVLDTRIANPDIVEKQLNTYFKAFNSDVHLILEN